MLPDAAQPARSATAQQAAGLLSVLQQHWLDALALLGVEAPKPYDWLRAQGCYGGGRRYQALGNSHFDRLALNFSQVQYEADAARPLASATALSCILHPRHPRWPSLHMHISWTEPKQGRGSWRLMADLNPALPDPEDSADFMQTLHAVAPSLLDRGKAEGERYFYIPALKRHRGVAHFYLEGLQTPEPLAEPERVHVFGQAMIDCYITLLQRKQLAHLPITAEDQAAQLAYHSLYLFQVLTLDRGTSSGLLVHSDNDIGILGSLPSAVDKTLLESWLPLLPAPQNQLWQAILALLPEQAPHMPCQITEALKPELAEVLRCHYRQYPEALALQARGSVVPPTLSNHQFRQEAH